MEQFTAFAPAIGVGGAGRTGPDALADLESSALELRADLEATPPSELDPSAAELLARLRFLLG